MNPTQDNTDLISSQDGVTDSIPSLSLDLSDGEIIAGLHQSIENSNTYYNDVKKFNLKNKRNKNKEFFDGKQVDENKLYKHQTPYVDNEIFVAKDAIIAYVCARTPQSEVYPANDTVESKVLAKNLEKYQFYHSEKFNIPRKMEGAVDNMIDKYVGFIKLRFNTTHGKHGEIVPEVVDPEHIIVDHTAKLGENPRFIAHIQKDTVEQLVARFPEKEEEIMRFAGIQRRGAKNMTKEVVYREVWFTYYDKKTGKPQEAVAWYTGKLVLDKIKNPNWLYDDEGENFLDTPMKPFIPFNLSNNGSNWIDKTNALEQAIPQQEILNKLGRQVMDNLASANGFKVFDSHALSSSDAENFTGDPNQLLLVKTKPNQRVGDVVQQFPPQMVSTEVISMLDKTRQVIHNIIGTPSQFTGGDDSKDQTASEALMIKNQASGRQDKIVRSIDYAMDLYYKFLTQMMVVWYDEDHYATVNGGDGKFDYIIMHRNKIETGMTVRVQSGTTLPFDKSRQEAVAANMLKLGVISPYDGYKLMHMDDPQQLYDNYIKFKSDPTALAQDLASDAANQDAIVDFTELLAGKEVEQREDPTGEYVEQFRKQLISDKFLKAKAGVQTKVLAFINKAIDSWEVRSELEAYSKVEEKTPTPTPLPDSIVQTGVPQIPQQMMGQPMQPMQPQAGMPMPMQGAPAPAGMPMQPQQPQPQMNPIQAIMQAQPQPVGMPPAPQASAPNLSPTAQPQVNAGNVGQLPPV